MTTYNQQLSKVLHQAATLTHLGDFESAKKALETYEKLANSSSQQPKKGQKPY